MEGTQIRETFLRFFEERDHRRVPSSSLIPPPESGLLLTNAGMNQFIPYFLGHAQAPFRRAVTAQKCFRALDIENVGHTDRHLTFFEMLGNFSFGDYFKAEACAWGLELVTEGFGLDPDRVGAVYETDEETIGISRARDPAGTSCAEQGRQLLVTTPRASGPVRRSCGRGGRYGGPGPEVDEDRHMRSEPCSSRTGATSTNVLRDLPREYRRRRERRRIATVLGVGSVFR
jgi:alanyl-tRNA synthetase